MGYNNKYEYEIIPTESFKIFHNCGGCGKKASFVNTNCFRVNANGRKLDIWLIYQCEKCKHTLNIPIHERMDKGKVDGAKYARFLSNDSKLAGEYGVDAVFFHKYELDGTGPAFEIREVGAENAINKSLCHQQGDTLLIHNPYTLKIRIEKIVGQLLDLTRSTTKRLLESGDLIAEKKGNCIEVQICTDLTY